MARGRKASSAHAADPKTDERAKLAASAIGARQAADFLCVVILFPLDLELIGAATLTMPVSGTYRDEGKKLQGYTIEQ
jgi:hypothetical protein